MVTYTPVDYDLLAAGGMPAGAASPQASRSE